MFVLSIIYSSILYPLIHSFFHFYPFILSFVRLPIHSLTNLMFLCKQCRIFFRSFYYFNDVKCIFLSVDFFSLLIELRILMIIDYMSRLIVCLFVVLGNHSTRRSNPQEGRRRSDLVHSSRASLYICSHVELWCSS